jgi:hypothetical protein
MVVKGVCGPDVEALAEGGRRYRGTVNVAQRHSYSHIR